MTSARIITGDCRVAMIGEGPFDMIVADPPYGDTALKWDRLVRGWEQVASSRLKPTGSMWVFGSLRFFMAAHRAIRSAGLRITQEIVWEKHNGSSLHNDRFRRVHELLVQVIRADARWADVYNDVQFTMDATARTVRRKRSPTHFGKIGEASYVSQDGGPRLARSVQYARSPRSGRHPTEKPVDLLELIIRTSCPPGGLVGDMFAGVGSAADAALATGRSYVGVEQDEAYASVARDRIASSLWAAA